MSKKHYVLVAVLVSLSLQMASLALKAQYNPPQFVHMTPVPGPGPVQVQGAIIGYSDFFAPRGRWKICPAKARSYTNTIADSQAM
jgi:hypothetical protein